MFGEVPKVFLHRDVVDFRKSINGLMALSKMNLNMMLILAHCSSFATKPETSLKFSIRIKQALRYGISGWKNKNSNGRVKYQTKCLN